MVKELTYKIHPSLLTRGLIGAMLAFALVNWLPFPANVWRGLTSVCFTFQAVVLAIPGKLAVRYDEALLELSGIKKLKISVAWSDVLIEQDDQESRLVKDRRTGSEIRIRHELLCRILKDTGHEDLLVAT